MIEPEDFDRGQRFVTSTLILFYKQHMMKKTIWMFLDFIQLLLIFVAYF